MSGLYFEITAHDDGSPQNLSSNFTDTVGRMNKSARFTSKPWFSNVANYRNWSIILCLTNITEDGYRNSICYIPSIGKELNGAWEILAWGNFNLSSNNYKIESLIQTS